MGLSSAEGRPVLVIGAGPAGLTAAYELAKRGIRAVVCEQDDQVGGLARTVSYRGYRFDIGGHWFFTKVETVQRLWEEVLVEDFLVRPRLSRIYYRDRFFDYPLTPLNALAGLGPVEASKQALARAGMTIDDIDLVEINEAFAAQVVPSYQDLGIDLDRLNVNGGAIAVGHPFGMTGARLQNTMLNSLDWHDKSTGLITMCVGGGQGMALILERLG